MKIPVLIRTRNRLEYLIHTFRSLEALPDYDNLDITIYDDCSDRKEMIQFLTTNNEIKLNYDFSKAFGKNEQLNRRVRQHINLPIITSVAGIKNKYKVYICDHTYGDRAGALNMIKTGFQLYPNNDYIIFLQGDILFNQNWLKKFLQIYEKQKNNNYGLISNCILDKLPNTKYIQKNNYSELIFGSLTFQSILVNRKVYQKLLENKEFQKKFLLYNNVENKRLLTSDSNYNIAGDTYICKRILSYGLKIFQTNESYIEHIGMKSDCRPFRDLILFSQYFNGSFVYNK